MTAVIAATAKLERIAAGDFATNDKIDITIDGFGTPSAVLCLACADAGDDTSASLASISFGGSDGTAQVCAQGLSIDGVATTDTGSDSDVDACVKVLGTTNGFTYSRLDAITGTGVGPITDGWKFNYEEATGGVDMAVIVIFFRGTDVKQDIQDAQTGTYSGYSFRPNVTPWWTRAEPVTDGTTNQVHVSFGVSWDTGSGIDDYAVSWGTRDNLAVSIVNSKRHSTASTMDVSNDTEDWADGVSTYESDGLTKTTNGVGEKIFSLSMNTSMSFKAGLIDLPNDDDAPWTVSGVGFQPQVLILVTSMVDTADNIETGVEAGSMGFAVADFNENNIASVSVSELDNDSGNTVAKSHADAQFLTLYNGSGTQEFDLTDVAATSDGWTVTDAQNVLNNGTARKAFYMAFGAPAAPAFIKPEEQRSYRHDGRFL